MTMARLTGWLSNDRLETIGSLSVTAALLPALQLSLSSGGLTTVNLSAIAGQLGTQVYINFVDGPTKRANMDKTALGNLQTRLFQKFGLFCSVTSILGLGTYQFLQR